jgi:hypothetical protein
MDDFRLLAAKARASAPEMMETCWIAVAASSSLRT